MDHIVHTCIKRVFLGVFFCGLFSNLSFSKPLVVTTTPTISWFVKEIAGNQVKVISLCKPMQDPHYLQAKPSYILKLKRADMLFLIGLDLEVAWLPLLLDSSRNPKIMKGASGYIDVSRFVEVIDKPKTKIDRSMGDIHPYGNPHFWLNPDNAPKIAQGIAEALKTLNVNKEKIDENLKKLLDRLNNFLINRKKEYSFLQGKAIVAYHTSFNYLARWLGMRIVGYIESKPGIPPTISHIMNLVRTMKKEDVKAILIERFYDTKSAEKVSSMTGAKIVSVLTEVTDRYDVGDYFKLIDAILSKIKKAYQSTD